MNMDRQTIIIFTICFFLTACNDNIPFDKTGWTIQGDLVLYPNRDKMLDDLTRNQKLKGLHYRQLICKIGEPEKNMVEDSNTIYYDIVTDYGYNI
jgi:hypothetical protein